MASSSSDELITPEFESPPLKKPEKDPEPKDILAALNLDQQLAENLFARMTKKNLRSFLQALKISTTMGEKSIDTVMGSVTHIVQHQVVVAVSGPKAAELVHSAETAFLHAIEGLIKSPALLNGALDTTIKHHAIDTYVFSWRQAFTVTE